VDGVVGDTCGRGGEGGWMDGVVGIGGGGPTTGGSCGGGERRTRWWRTNWWKVMWWSIKRIILIR
jgi:hypothetical protein